VRSKIGLVDFLAVGKQIGNIKRKRLCMTNVFGIQQFKRAFGEAMRDTFDPRRKR